MTSNEIFGDGEVLGALITVLLIVGPMLAIVAYDKYKERKRQKILKLCGEAQKLLKSL